ncbi:hypothetical protein NL529_31335, partial [Klebsiella pneumoniae]|nr:hypothetical protein [Klebsiella pneumoniae]
SMVVHLKYYVLWVRYTSTIAELEQARQQTWEEKAKLSAVFEEERRKLVIAVLCLRVFIGTVVFCAFVVFI